MNRAFIATDVFHYEHVVKALSKQFDTITLSRRWELGEHHRSLVSKLPNGAQKVAERRIVDRHLPGNVASRSLGPAQVIVPVTSRLTSRPVPLATLASKTAYARRVSMQARGHEFFHFTEGLGFVSLRRHEFQMSVCERRHFHHSVLEGSPQVAGDFPHVNRRDPLRDILAEEYKRSDFILVYSQGARESFLERGFDPAKVIVSPLGVDIPARNRPHSIRSPFQLAFVGRCDAFKGVDVAVAAVEALGAPWTLTVAGPASSDVQRWMKSKNRVNYVGVLSAEQLQRLYGSARFLLVPSIESFGYAAADALMAGTPTLLSDQAGVSEFVTPRAFTRMSSRDPNLWASVIIEAAGTFANDTMVASLARESLLSNSWDSASQILLSRYSEMRRIMTDRTQ